MATDWLITSEDITEKIPHLDQPDYYDADRKYHRIIRTGNIIKDSPEARIIASNININGQKLENKFSSIMAGNNLDINVNSANNIGYQGTIHFDDSGRDRHYWKRKEKKKFLGINAGSKWKYGHTDIPYDHHQVFDDSVNSNRLAILGSGLQTNIHAGQFVNKTIEADGAAYELKGKEEADDLSNNIDIAEYDSIMDNAKNKHANPLARFQPEMDAKFINKQKFLSSKLQ